MSSASRQLKYGLAINEALHQAMAADDSVVVIGQGVKSPWYVGNTCLGLRERFGDERVMDTPVSENAITGAAVGAAIVGMRPVVIHPRLDFMMYAFDPIFNEAANWHYMCGGRSRVPLVIWGIVNRGGEQAAQHSQALHAMFAHAPGLKVVAPSTPYDAKGLMISAIRDNNPVFFMDDRWLYGQEGVVPEKSYRVEIGKGILRRKGKDVTLVGVSCMMIQCLQAAAELAEAGIETDVIDLRTVKPLDTNLVARSVRKTGRLVIADGGWRTCGLAGEIAALAAESMTKWLKSPVKRVTLPDIPAPASRALEHGYYRTARDIVLAARQLMNP